jgi:RND superfamily putative drug exporter
VSSGRRVATPTPRNAAPRVPRWLRVLLPTALILVWLAAAGIGGPYFGRIGEVSSNDQTTFLPASAEATRAQELQRQFSDTDAIPAIVLFEADAALTADELDAIDSLVGGFDGVDGVADDTSPAMQSEDRRAVEVFVPIDGDEPRDVVAALREAVTAGSPPGVTAYVTGPAGFTADIAAAFSGIDGLLLLVALSAVLVILLIVYRSPLLPLFVLGTSVFALAASILAVWWLAFAGFVMLNGQVQGILFILVIGAATDYSLLYVSRYREALRDHENRWDATWVALKGAFEPIVASGGTVIVGLLCLLFSDLNSNKALGPVASLGVLLSIVASLTLLPALLLTTGRAAFWPVRPMFGSSHPTLAAEGGARGVGVWGRVGRLVTRHARVVWTTSTLVLLIAAMGVLQLKANGVPQSDLVLGASEARDGQVALAEHFPGGSGAPATILGAAGAVDELADAATDVPGVDSVVAVANDSPSGTVPIGPDSSPLPGSPFAGIEPTVVNGRVLLQATLADPPDSASAEEAVLALRAAVTGVDPEALVGGTTATAVDTNATSIDDRNTIIPIVLAVILGILMLLLRSILAPVLLILSVIVSFAASLGVSAVVFNGIFEFPGADPSVPLYAFVFLVALGIDYNIFLMTRVREESLRHGTRSGTLRGLTATGGVITSAGIVLAATFAALAVIPILFLVQIAFIVAFGVLLDTLIVRSLLVPALAHDIGPGIWWPSKLGRTDGKPAGAHAGPTTMETIRVDADAVRTR